MCVLNLGRDVSVVEVTIGPGDRSAAVSLHGVIKFVVVVKLNPVAQLVDDDRIDLNRGAFHQVIGAVGACRARLHAMPHLARTQNPRKLLQSE